MAKACNVAGCCFPACVWVCHVLSAAMSCQGLSRGTPLPPAAYFILQRRGPFSVLHMRRRRSRQLLRSCCLLMLLLSRPNRGPPPVTKCCTSPPAALLAGTRLAHCELPTTDGLFAPASHHSVEICSKQMCVVTAPCLNPRDQSPGKLPSHARGVKRGCQPAVTAQPHHGVGLTQGT